MINFIYVVFLTYQDYRFSSKDFEGAFTRLDKAIDFVRKEYPEYVKDVEMHSENYFESYEAGRSHGITIERRRVY